MQLALAYQMDKTRLIHVMQSADCRSRTVSPLPSARPRPPRVDGRPARVRSAHGPPYVCMSRTAVSVRGRGGGTSGCGAWARGVAQLFKKGLLMGGPDNEGSRGLKALPRV